MKRTFIYLTAFVMLTTACNQQKKEPGSVLSGGVNAANMDTTVIPGDDFYQYACGGWMKSNPLKPEHARFGTFDELRETSQKQVRELIEGISSNHNEAGSISQKIEDLYVLATDTATLTKQGAEPLKAYLKKNVDQLKDKSELTARIATLFRDGVNPFFGCYVYIDDKNSSNNIFHLVQGGYDMGDRDYYLENDTRSQEIRAKYIAMIEQLFTLSGYPEDQAKEASATVMKMETQLAKAAYSRIELREPEKNYHKITVEELKKTAPEINWNVFFETIGLKDVKELNLSQPEPIAEASKMIKQYSIQDIKYYLAWNVINNSANYLSDEFVYARFDFYGKTLSGKLELQPRWKRAVDIVNGALGEAVGQIYVEKHFPAPAKERMLGLVKNLQTALGERINNLSWMGDSTKAKAQEKLATFHIKIGYPDKWRDYSALKINKNDSYLTTIIHSNNFDFDYMMSKFNKPADKDEWLMTPQTVNAYYNPATNEICFPAAILQPPFFNMEADDAVNYGAIGVVIGHEMTHGFDDQGRQYDKDGNLKDWWTEEDAKKFNERTQVLVNFFDNIIVADTIHANGTLTLGENIADQGGLQVSWQAYQNSLKGKTESAAPIGGFNYAQRFFLGYATVWGSNIRNEEILRLTKIDPHSLGKWRVNAALPQIDAWYDAFGIKETNKLYIPKEKRVSIW